VIGSALFNPFVYISGSPPVAFARTDNSGRPIPRRHPLILIVDTRVLSSRINRAVCACTHYLVFKEPTAETPLAPRRLFVAGVASPLFGVSPEGSHRPGRARKASPLVGSGAFRGTF
jgi:hypothetical protein